MITLGPLAGRGRLRAIAGRRVRGNLSMHKRSRAFAYSAMIAALAAIAVPHSAAPRAEQPVPPQAKAGVPATAAIGRITLSPAPDQPFSPNVPWLAHRPDGTLVDCADTQTSCFQEAENQAFAKRWSIDVYGPVGAVVSAINASRGINLHPRRHRCIALHGILLSRVPT